MTTLGDFASYDLGRVLEAVRGELAEHPDNYAGSALRASFVKYASWDYRWRNCWADPSFLARYTWLREQLAIDTSPQLADVVDVLARLVDERVALDTPIGDEPF